MTNAERQKRYRERKRNKSVMPEKKNVTQNVTPWYPNKRTDDKGNPITPVKLSDGQLRYPVGKRKETNRESPGLISALADPVRRDKIQRITASLRQHGVLEGVRYGIGGPTFKTIDEVINRKLPVS